MYKLNSRVTINRYTSVKNEFGGLIPIIDSQWSKWAEVQDRSGSSTNDYQQSQWTYDSVIVMRYEKERPLHSNDVIVYEGYNYKINSIQIRKEAAKSWEYIQATKLDETINSDSPMDTGSIQIYTEIPAENDYIITVPSLIGTTIFGVFKDGVLYTQVSSFGAPENKEVIVNTTTGEFTFSTIFSGSEVMNVQYF